MTEHFYKYHSRYSIEQIYELITDVENYPEFLPWCKGAQIIEESQNSLVADLIISFKVFTEHYRSRVDLKPPARGKAAVEVNLIHGPFKNLYNSWKLKKNKKGGTDIEFFISFEFNSALLEKFIGLLFSKACQKMVTAFEHRADQKFG
ncbi:MAG: type II toxin-antitoxin system RatA family toxin [Rickettsiales bacterium]